MGVRPFCGLQQSIVMLHTQKTTTRISHSNNTQVRLAPAAALAINNHRTCLHANTWKPQGITGNSEFPGNFKEFREF